MVGCSPYSKSASSILNGGAIRIRSIASDPKSYGLVICSGESIKICNSSVDDCPTVLCVRSKIVTASVTCKYFGKSASAFSLESVLSYFGT